MSARFPDDEPISQQYIRSYRESWASLSPALRDRLRAGVDEVDSDDLQELIAAPHPFVTLTEWLNQPESRRWNLHSSFAEWAATEAPSEDELRADSEEHRGL